MSTIYALSSGSGRAGIAVIRISGDDAFSILKEITKKKVPPPRRAEISPLYDSNNDLLDKAVTLTFKSPHSYTGEDIVELHVHGGQAVINSIFNALNKFDNIKHADPGEFTRRAFLNGKLDLTKAEGVIDLINAQTDLQRKIALEQSNGKLYQLYEEWSNRIKKSTAYIEACIDFSDEDLPEDTWKNACEDINLLMLEINQNLKDGQCAERIRSGVKVVIIGPPNVGKSSLLNWFLGRNIAIVSDISGTTRDSIETTLEIEGIPFTLIDTAGIKDETDDIIEKNGIEISLNHAQNADIRLFLFDVSQEKEMPLMPDFYNEETDLIVFNKSDKIKTPPSYAHKTNLLISITNKDNMDRLLSTLKDKLNLLTKILETPAVTRSRHRNALILTYSHLQNFTTATLPEIAAEELHCALHQIARITGRVDIEDLLDIVFSDFCIGK